MSRSSLSPRAAFCSSRSLWALEGLGLLGEVGGVFAGTLAFADLFREAVALGLEGFELGDAVAASAVDGGEVAEEGGGVGVAGAQGGFDGGQVCPDVG